MKNLKNTLGTLLMTALVLASCTKNDGIDVPVRPSAQEFALIKQLTLDGKKQEFQFNAEDGVTTLTSENGVTIIIDGSCLTLNGSAVTGTVDLDYVELFGKGDMLTTNKPTMGVLPSGDKALLVSGGEFLLEVTQNGVELETNCNFQLIIPANLTGGEDNDMILWEGNIVGEDNLEWNEVEDQGGPNGGRVFAEGGQYYVFGGNFGWTNVDRFYNDPRPKTTILVDVPEGYDNTNSAVYLSYDGEAPALANLDTYDAGNELFSEHYGQIPIGLECHVIFATEENGNWRYAVKAVTIVENGIITIAYDDTAVVTEAQLNQIISNLP
ncbi:MAG TPA: hypothetical protein ENK46_09735 [Flavobacteriia bacterium]|nr:hypothetical protein [Flavobacteriia bacterium]